MNKSKSLSKNERSITTRLANIDKLADSSKYLHQVVQEFVEIRDLYIDQKKEAKSKDIQIIIDVLSFRLEDDEIKEMASGTDDKGEPWQYPNTSSFTPKTFKIIEDELAKTESLKFRSHYADFLWLAKKEHSQAKIAVESYLELSKVYEKKDKQDKESKEHYGLDLLNSLQRAFTISRQINFMKEETRERLEDLVSNFNPESNFKNKLTIDLINIAISHKKEFPNDFLEKLLIICKERANSLMKEEGIYFARSFWECGHKIENSLLKRNTKEWKVLIAESYIIEANKTTNKDNFVGLSALTNAINAYQQLGDKEKVEEIKGKYKTLSKKVKFQRFEHKMDVKPLIKHADSQAQKLLKLKPEEILMYLATSKGLYPSHAQVKERGDKLSEKFISRRLLGRVSFDRNMNLVGQADSEEDEFFNDYNLDIDVYSIFIDVLLKKMISEGKINWREVKKFFRKHLWFGVKYSIPIDDGDTVESEKWINLLEPGLKLYFSIAKKFYNGKKKKYPFSEIMLSTESLSLKIEGLIREFFQKLSIPTTTSEQIAGGKTILKERDLNSLLRDEQAVEIFGEDLVTLMRAVLVEKSVYNLRNNIAHSFLMREHFHFAYLHLLFIIILRIGSYTFKQK